MFAARFARTAVALGALALGVVAIAACHGTKREDLAAPARARIVSVGGAVTETVFALGAGAEVIADDTSSVYPENASKLPKIGYQPTLAAEGILSLSPTLVLASSEAGPPAVLEQLRVTGLRVESISGAATVQGAHERIEQLARVLQKDPKPVSTKLDASLARAQDFVQTTKTRPRVLALYARGASTLLVFGKNSAADAMLALAGATNAVSGFEGTKPVTSEAVIDAAPDVILLPARGLESLGGVSGLLALPGISGTPAAKAQRVITLDDLLLLGFGPRTGEAVLELARKLHPEELASQAAP